MSAGYPVKHIITTGTTYVLMWTATSAPTPLIPTIPRETPKLCSAPVNLLMMLWSSRGSPVTNTLTFYYRMFLDLINNKVNNWNEQEKLIAAHYEANPAREFVGTICAFSLLAEFLHGVGPGGLAPAIFSARYWVPGFILWPRFLISLYHLSLFMSFLCMYRCWVVRLKYYSKIFQAPLSIPSLCIVCKPLFTTNGLFSV